jgi:hypothetical protein
MKNIETQKTESGFLHGWRRDLFFISIGLIFAVFPYLYPQDFLYFRIPFFAFIAFEFGIRAGLQSTFPVTILSLIIQPKWEGVNLGEAEVISAMIITGPVVACIAAGVRKNERLQKKLLPLLGVFIAGLSYMLYIWLQGKQNIFKIPVICTIAIAAYFLYRYRKNIGYVRALLWILVLYYLAAFVIYFPISRFHPNPSLFLNIVLSLFPADILAVILGGALLPQMESLISTMKRERFNK